MPPEVHAQLADTCRLIPTRYPAAGILDAKTRREVKRLTVGRGAAGSQMEPGGSRAFVSCTPDGYVAVIDLRTLEVAGHIDASKQPDGLAWAVRH